VGHYEKEEVMENEEVLGWIVIRRAKGGRKAPWICIGSVFQDRALAFLERDAQDLRNEQSGRHTRPLALDFRVASVRLEPEPEGGDLDGGSDG
jgi:hypothetical protein